MQHLRSSRSLVVLAALVQLSATSVPAASEAETGAADPTIVRIATFNIKEMSTAKLTNLDEAAPGDDAQLRAAARIVQQVRPDILLLQEIDAVYVDGEAEPELNPRRFIDAYLAFGDRPIDYPYVYAAPCNTGVVSGVDLNGDGTTATADDLGTRVWGGDSLGWGEYPGQYSMAVLSRFPIDRDAVRTFRKLLWRDLPGDHLPPGFYSVEALRVLPLSSKSHWDMPVDIDGRALHLWVSHPTPPVFDGPEDRNGRRNLDEIRFWGLYPEGWSGLVDDQGRKGGYQGEAPFVILGDLNADPNSESRVDDRTAIAHLLEELPGIQDPGSICSSAGAPRLGETAPSDYPERATAAFQDGMRLDYVLPSRDLEIVGGGVFWPSKEEDPDGHSLAETASDHRLVWIDVVLP